MANEKTSTEILSMAVKAAGEYVVPGGSNFVKGDLKEGISHAVLGLAAKAVFGLPGLIVVSLDSLTQAISDKSIPEHLGLWQKREGSDETPARPRPAK